jgi:hypothetical protein
MTTRWRVVDLDGWAFDGPQVTLVYDADDLVTVEVIEEAAEGAGVILERIEPEPEPLPEPSDGLR